ncbi:MAG: hypothetical protein ACI96N_001525 [Arenicella sp.]|jgi:hypothetical protein
MKILKLAVALLVTAWVSSANAALVYDFNWGTPGNEIIGEVRGIDALETDPQAASNIIITFFLGEALNIDFDVTAFDNAFQIVNNELMIAANININDGGDDTQHSLIFSVSSAQEITFRVEDYATGGEVERTFFDGGFTQRAVLAPEVLVPEPTTAILLSLGLAGLSFARYRRQS